MCISSITQSCPTLCNPMDCSTAGIPVHHQLLEPTQTHVHRVGDAMQPSHLLSSLSPPAFNLSQHQSLFQWVSSSHQVAKYGVSALASVLLDIPPPEYSGLISFRIDCFDLLEVQGTLNSLLQHHSLKHQFFCAQLSLWSNYHHPFMTIGKTIALTRQTFVGKVMFCFLVCCLG